jgi:DNA-binding NarL/FixJ family response regulator
MMVNPVRSVPCRDSGRKGGEEIRNAMNNSNELSGPPDRGPPSAGRPPIRVCLVDDEPDFHLLFKEWLKTMPGVEFVAGFLTAEAALREIPTLQIDLIFLDVMLRGVPKGQCLEKLKALMPATMVIMITGAPRGFEVLFSVSEGAGGYVYKQEGPEAVSQVIDRWREGLSMLSPEAGGDLVKALNESRTASGATSLLTNRQLRILNLRFAGKRRKEVAEEMECSVATVDTHCRRACKNLGVRNLREAKAMLRPKR